MAKKPLFSNKFRTQLSEKIMELGNLIAVALIFGQFLSGKSFSLPVFLSGILLTLTCYIIAYIISK